MAPHIKRTDPRIWNIAAAPSGAWLGTPPAQLAAAMHNCTLTGLCSCSRCPIPSTSTTRPCPADRACARGQGLPGNRYCSAMARSSSSSSVRNAACRCSGRVCTRFSIMARRRRGICRLPAPNRRISRKAMLTKSSQFGVRKITRTLAGVVDDLLGAQVAQADQAQQAVQLVDGEHRGGRIVDRRRQRLRGNVHQDAEREHRILLHGALGAEGGQLAQPFLVDLAGVAVDVEQGLAGGDEIADLRREFDDDAGALRLGDQRPQVHRQQDLRPAQMRERAVRRAALAGARLHPLGLALENPREGRAAAPLARGQRVHAPGRVRVDAFDHLDPLLADQAHQAHGTKEFRRIVDEEQEGDEADGAEHEGQRNLELVHLRIRPCS